MLRGFVACAVAFAATSAFAGGEIYWREIQSTSAFPCDGRLVEFVAESGAMSYFSSDLFLACLTDENHASHILIAGNRCGGSQKCARVPPRDAPPGLIASKSFWERRKIDFTLTKFALGSDCRIEKQKVVYDSTGTSSEQEQGVWLCREFQVHSGVNSNMDGWKTVPITDTGSGKLKPNADPLTSTFVALPDDAYNLDWLSNIYHD